jgi:hypothetical protein
MHDAQSANAEEEEFPVTSRFVGYMQTDDI